MDALVPIVVGLGYGDEGKGTTVDWLVRHYAAHTVVRFNGGAQAGHNVVLPDGRHHCFAQFGAGTFAGARTHLSKYMLVNPIAAYSEASVLEDKGIADLALTQLSCHEDAIVTTPFHVSMNRLRELARGDARHGSCGMGIGETVDGSHRDPQSTIRIRDLRDARALRRKLKRQQEIMVREQLELPISSEDLGRSADYRVIVAHDTVERTEAIFQIFSDRISIVDDDWVRALLEQPGVVFEGAQGVLLDETFGFAPHNTWSTCTFTNAMALLAGLDVQPLRLGVTRSFHTRHGAGPFVTERKDAPPLERDHNQPSKWQGNFRHGSLDLVALRYAVECVGGIEGLVMTWLDRFVYGDSYCTEYQIDFNRVDRISQIEGDRTDVLFRARPRCDLYCGDGPQFFESIASALHAEPALMSFGPTYRDKTKHRGLR